MPKSSIAGGAPIGLERSRLQMRAAERVCSGNEAGLEMRFRLVAQHTWHRCRASRERLPLDHPSIHLGLEESMGVASAVLRVVHRGVRALDQRFGILPVIWENADADACIDVQVVVRDGMRRRQRCFNLSASLAAFRGCSTSESTITNSSLPWRLTVSEPRTAAVSRLPTSCNSPSPIAWPSESLICLNRSRSRKSTATGGRGDAPTDCLVEAVIQ